jgi:NAD(P)-dependent dehydrogenase (short-subunit alcohol dehydrogenase family)
MVGKLAGRRAYVTGGSSGIGAAVVAAVAAEGADVAIGASRHAGQAEVAATKLSAAGRHAVVITADLANRAEADRAAEKVPKELGGLDIFVDCAGIDVTKTHPKHHTAGETRASQSRGSHQRSLALRKDQRGDRAGRDRTRQSHGSGF